MKFSQFAVLMSACALAASAFADAANALISFSTPGPDRYADGTTVKDGEWYALVWSQDGVFEGITADCKALGAGDEVLLVASLAKDGKCPYMIFQVDSAKAHDTGVYGVYLLDTRTADGSQVAAANADGKPASVNGAALTQGYTAAAATAGGAKTGPAIAARAWDASAVDTAAEGFSQAKIAAIEVKGAQVKLTVTGLMPAVKYNVRMGEKPDALTDYALTTPKSDVREATFEIDAKDAKFFQIVREPLVK